MISGALFLKRDIQLKIIFKKYIFRIVMAYVFWSAIYSCHLLLNGTLTKKEAIIHFINGHYHLWFLYMIVGLYLLIPICKAIVSNKNITRYFLILWFAFDFLVPFVFEIGRYTFESVSYTLEDSFKLMYVTMPLGYVGYFVLGYYLNTIEIEKKQEVIIYSLGIVGLIAAVFGTSWLSCAADNKAELLVRCILFFAVAVFVFAKQHLNGIVKNNRVKRVLAKLSNCSFGVYLVHALVLNLVLRMIDYQTLFNNLVLATLAISVLVFILSYVVSLLLNCIPFVKKYFV